MAPQRKTWFENIPADLADEIREALRVIASGESQIDCAALARAVIDDLKTRKQARKYSGAIPSESVVWQSLRRKMLALRGGVK